MFSWIKKQMKMEKWFLSDEGLCMWRQAFEIETTPACPAPQLMKEQGCHFLTSPSPNPTLPPTPRSVSDLPLTPCGNRPDLCGHMAFRHCDLRTFQLDSTKQLSFWLLKNHVTQSLRLTPWPTDTPGKREGLSQLQREKKVNNVPQSC